MVFVLHQPQNKDTIALHLKLNELIADSADASNRLADPEEMTAEELATLKKFYIKLSNLAEKEDNIHQSHSIDEAQESHDRKVQNNP